MGEKLGIKLVATNDCHYLSREDAKVQNVLVCIQTNATVSEGSPLSFPTDEFYVKSREEMEAALPDFSDALDNTEKIAARCRVEFTFGELKLPKFTPPGGRDSTEYFVDLCTRGLKKRYGTVTPELKERFDYEMSVVRGMGYVDYYLIVYDFVRYAKSVGIPVGPGRGSGAASLLAYCMGITGIDPMKYQLIFERFLNPERISMPDFDIDFSDERRQEVIDYVVRRYGGEGTAGHGEKGGGDAPSRFHPCGRCGHHRRPGGRVRSPCQKRRVGGDPVHHDGFGRAGAFKDGFSGASEPVGHRPLRSGGAKGGSGFFHPEDLSGGSGGLRDVFPGRDRGHFPVRVGGDAAAAHLHEAPFHRGSDGGYLHLPTRPQRLYPHLLKKPHKS